MQREHACSLTTHTPGSSALESDYFVCVVVGLLLCIWRSQSAPGGRAAGLLVRVAVRVRWAEPHRGHAISSTTVAVLDHVRLAARVRWAESHHCHVARPSALRQVRVAARVRWAEPHHCHTVLSATGGRSSANGGTSQVGGASPRPYCNLGTSCGMAALGSFGMEYLKRS